MAANTDDNGVGDTEGDGINYGEDQGEPGCEADKAGTIADALIEVVMMLVVFDGKPGRYGCSDSGKHGQEDEGASMTAFDVTFAHYG